MPDGAGGAGGRGGGGDSGVMLTLPHFVFSTLRAVLPLYRYCYFILCKFKTMQHFKLWSSNNFAIQKTYDYWRGTGGRKSAPIIRRAVNQMLDSLTHARALQTKLQCTVISCPARVRNII